MAFIQKAIAVLTICLNHSKFNYDAKIMLMKLYSRLNVFEPMSKLFKELQIRHIQLDSMSYLVMNDAHKFSHMSYISELTASIVSFHNEYHRDNSEFILGCFNNGTYSKIEEFMDLKNKMEKSFAFQQALVYQGFYMMIGCGFDEEFPAADRAGIRIEIENASKQLTVGASDFTFNDDVSVLSTWGLGTLQGDSEESNMSTRIKDLQRDAALLQVCISCEKGQYQNIQSLLEIINQLTSEVSSLNQGSHFVQKMWLFFRNIAESIISLPSRESGSPVEFLSNLKQAEASLQNATEMKPAFMGWKEIPALSVFLTRLIPCVARVFQTWHRSFPKKKGPKQNTDEALSAARGVLKSILTTFVGLLSDLHRVISSSNVQAPFVQHGEAAKVLENLISATSLQQVQENVESGYKSSADSALRILSKAIESIAPIKF